MTCTRVTYLVEQYRPGLELDELQRLAARVRLAVDTLEGSGQPIRLVSSTIVPADESILCVVEAVSEELVHEAYARAGSAIERISAAIDQGGQR
ncbi:MAG TPA: nickel-binding protein [Gaiellaceae bacterium]